MAEFKKIDPNNTFNPNKIVSKKYNYVTDYFEIRAKGVGGGGGGEEPVYVNPDPVAVTVGGIEKGDNFFVNGKTFSEVMYAMFYPVIYPSLIDPSHSVSADVVSLYEIDDDINVDITTTFDRGAIMLDGSKQNDRSGAPTQYNYTGPQLPATVPSTSDSNLAQIGSYVVPLGYTTWTSSVSYSEGPQPVDSYGNPYGSPYPAGTTSAIAVRIEGVYPLFATTVDVLTMTKQALVSMITGNYIELDLATEVGGKQSFEIPADWGRPLQDIETYNEFSGKWESTGLSKWGVSNTTETIQSNIVSYKKYTYIGSDRGAVRIRLIF